MNGWTSKRGRHALGLAALLCGFAVLGVMAFEAARGLLPRKETLRMGVQRQAATEARAQERQGLDLNAATYEELLALPGIGAHLAGQIILRRGQQPFHFLEDLRSVPGIGQRRLAALRGLVYVEMPEEPETGSLYNYTNK